MKRRTFLTTAAGFAGSALAGLPAFAQDMALPLTDLFLAEDHPLQATWSAWKELCLSQDGRVIDGFQDNVSHSEGQGYGLTLAAIFGDSQTVNRILEWTSANLAVRADALLAWRWNPATSPQVTDRNNASDGDLFYAWGLILAAARFNRPELIAPATAMMADLLRLATAPHPDGSGRRLLLPGVNGFRQHDGLIVNPSYYMARAMQDLAQATGLQALSSLARDGQEMISALGQAGPVPDWVQVTAAGISQVPPPFSGNSGYEAVRVTLFQIWSGAGKSPAVRAWAEAAEAAGPVGGAVTVWTLPGGAVQERSSHEGYAAVAALSRCTLMGDFGALMPAFNPAQPYYPATLHLMALVAQATTYPRCVPI